jgi:hypothetical protein
MNVQDDGGSMWTSGDLVLMKEHGRGHHLIDTLVEESQ